MNLFSSKKVGVIWWLLLNPLLINTTNGASSTMNWEKQLEQYNEIWTTPSQNSSGSMPIGNGDIGLNVWVEANGDLLFYLSKTDAWSETGRLLKLGRIRIRLTPNPVTPGTKFRQELRLRTGEIVIQAGDADSGIALRIWVDAHQPVVRIEASGRIPFEMTARLEIWRITRRPLLEPETHSAYGLIGTSAPIWVEPDTVLPAPGSEIIWYHRNPYSIWAENLNLQGLETFRSQAVDPLLHRTFGACLRGENFHPVDSQTLQSNQAASGFVISIFPLTAQAESPAAWLNQLRAQIHRLQMTPLEVTRQQHRKWWENFWARSWIFVQSPTGSDAEIHTEAATVTRGYILQRWMNACAGRGAFPIKFNGSIFTVDARYQEHEFDADFRRWGECYWWQNTRLPYWSMLTSGDFELMLPLFQMYTRALPLARHRTQVFYHHPGVFFPETMYFWGTHNNNNYGWNRTDKPVGLTDNRYIRYEWQGGIELTAMLLDYYQHTQDPQFLNSTLLPFAAEIINFYDQHYARDAAGKIRFWPAQALETYWDSVNPMPEIAGLHWILSQLLALPEKMLPRNLQHQWQRMFQALPALPTHTIEGEIRLAAAGEIGAKANQENPELYAIFPYPLFGVGKPDLELAQRTFNARIHPGTFGWHQTPIQAAILGLTDTARTLVVQYFSTKDAQSRFPAFWGPNYDWVPDQDHGSVALIALQRMLLQTNGRTVYLGAAWPKEWDVSFKLYAPENTVITGVYQNQQLTDLQVTPASRRRDIVFLFE
ncbi:DUF5703 domain-containing protein [candidate division KSB1 bacterium]|nr:DUF5703 domain-containing protein [candidate division KSB1 bacterium]